MNIIMVSLDFPPTLGGISAHVYELSNALSNSGHQVSIITRKIRTQEKEYSEINGIKIFKLHLKYFAPLYGRQINNYIKKKLPELRPDIIHVHGMAPLEGYSIRDVPLAYTNHTSGYLRRVQKGGFRRMALIKRSFLKPKLFLAPSRELLETPFDIPAKKIFIPNGVVSRKYRFIEQDRKKIRRELNMGPDDLVGIVTRRLVEKNGVVYLARATKHINNRQLKLVIIGDGEERGNIEKEFMLTFKDRFLMLGAKTHDQIIPFYSAADFSILPSLMEATSISGLEAMSSTLPLVGTRVGGIPELVTDGFNGFLCLPADEMDLAEKIDLLLQNDLKKMGTNSRNLILENFDWQRIAQQTIQAYKSVL